MLQTHLLQTLWSASFTLCSGPIINDEPINSLEKVL